MELSFGYVGVAVGIDVGHRVGAELGRSDQMWNGARTGISTSYGYMDGLLEDLSEVTGLLPVGMADGAIVGVLRPKMGGGTNEHERGPLDQVPSPQLQPHPKPNPNP